MFKVNNIDTRISSNSSISIVNFDQGNTGCSVAYFLEYVLLFLNDNVDEKCEHFSISKSSPLGFCLAFA